MLSIGMNDLEMQNRLGHADIKTTLGTYPHGLDQMQRKK